MFAFRRRRRVLMSEGEGMARIAFVVEVLVNSDTDDVTASGYTGDADVILDTIKADLIQVGGLLCDCSEWVDG